MRDLLGKFAPGLIFLLSLQHALAVDLTSLAGHMPDRGWRELFSAQANPWLWIFWVAAIPTCMIAGLLLQVTGEFLCIHRAAGHPWPPIAPLQRVVSSFIENAKQSFDDQLRCLVLLRKAQSEDRLLVGVSAQYERFVALKEGSGNFSLALIAATISLWYFPAPGWSEAAVFVLAAMAFALWYVHCVHAVRQATYMIATLQAAGDLDEAEAQLMKSRLPRWIAGGMKSSQPLRLAPRKAPALPAQARTVPTKSKRPRLTV